ncbi:2-hydroxyacyl-CoA dehydratase family protein [Citricoccus nitrophenolicus]|uniref:2-hydroxyacyl-CoA dehydratase family protein n=1 Tax=Citricoccus nitrophenolicus TaxID=863575 RepID=A0ABV0IIR6_9MICC
MAATAAAALRIGVVGADVPRQLLLAAGATPVRLSGAWSGEVSREAAELLGAADAVAARVLDAVLSGAHDDLAGLVVCNDSMAHLRVYYVLRVLAGRGRFPFPVHLLDTPRGGGAHRNRFVARQYERLADFATGRTGTAVDAAALADAAVRETLLGRALQRVRDRRRDRTLTGAAALRCYAAAGRLTPEEAVAEIQAVLDAATAPTTPPEAADGGAVPVFMTGSAHPDPSVYEELERAGFTVVGEDHDTGDAAWIGAAVPTGTAPAEAQSDPTPSQRWGSGHFAPEGGGGTAEAASPAEAFSALAELHARRSPAAARSLSAERTRHLLEAVETSGAAGVLALVRDLDDGPAWDLADHREALAGSGRWLAAVVQVPADGVPEATAELLSRIHAQEATS